MNSECNRPLLYVVNARADDPNQHLASSLAEMLDAASRVQFKLEQHQLMLATARSAWLAESTTELDESVRDFQIAEATFVASLRPVAVELTLAPEATFREIARASVEPWDYLFRCGADDLRQALGRVDTAKQGLQEMLTRNYLAVTSALTVLGVPTPVAYDASGTPSGEPTPSVLFNTRA